VEDRRSAIVRQAAHLLVVLAAELGAEFEKDALHFVPELFKCVVITVQIIAESGDAGVRGKAVHVDPMKPTLKGLETKRFKLKYDKLVSSFAFNFNLRRYSAASSTTATRRACCPASSRRPAKTRA